GEAGRDVPGRDRGQGLVGDRGRIGHEPRVRGRVRVGGHDGPHVGARAAGGVPVAAAVLHRVGHGGAGRAVGGTRLLHGVGILVAAVAQAGAAGDAVLGAHHVVVRRPAVDRGVREGQGVHAALAQAGRVGREAGRGGAVHVVLERG